MSKFNCIVVSLTYLFAVYITTCICKPITVVEENWNEILTGEWMVEFMAPWCPACRQFTETWEKFSDWSRDLDINVGVVDVTESPGLSGRFLVAALPTIYHIKDGVFRQYKGGRKENELISFIDDRKWQELEPVPWWYSPSSVQMSAVSFFFKTAMLFRSLYSTMTSEYGIPEWACYIIFAIFTIVLGLVLGLVIVICCDFICPSKPSDFQPRKKRRGQGDGANDQKEDEDADGEESETDIIDDRNLSDDKKLSEEIPKDADNSQSSEEAKSPDIDIDVKPRRRRAKKAD